MRKSRNSLYFAIGTLVALFLSGTYQQAVLGPRRVSEKPLPPATTAVQPEAGKFYTIHRVVDGDTVAADIGGGLVKIRLIGLNTPETVDPRRTVECFGKEASAKANEILEGSSVLIEMDTSQGAYDKYDRLLAYLILPDGTNFNKMMIEEGYGHEYTYELPYKYQKEFKEAERSAREQKKGLWADGRCEE